MNRSVLLALPIGGLLGLALHAEAFRRHAERRYPPQGSFVQVEGLKLHYVERGTGQPVVLLHGDSGSTYDFTWSPLFDRLAEDFRVIAFDRPGLGYSERPARDGASPFTQARLLHAAVRKLGIERPIVVGHSRGGAVLLAWAVEYPDDLAAAVGLAPAAYPGSVPAYSVMEVPLLGDLLYYLAVYPAERFRLLPITRRSLDDAFAPDGPAPCDYAETFVSLWLRRRHAKAALSDIAHGGDDRVRLAARFSEIRVPFVIVNGLADGNVPPAWASQLRNAILRCEVILLPNTGHELMFNRPDEVAAAVHLASRLAVERPSAMPVSSFTP